MTKEEVKVLVLGNKKEKPYPKNYKINRTDIWAQQNRRQRR